jgi:hypothetical protein
MGTETLVKTVEMILYRLRKQRSFLSSGLRQALGDIVTMPTARFRCRTLALQAGKQGAPPLSGSR